MAATNAPKDPGERARRNVPERGEWQASTVRGWQHGRVPAPPPKCLKVTRDVWETWFRSWFAAFWQPEDLPGLYLVAKLYDSVMRDNLAKAAELRISMDSYGMTPKGQQDRRWKRPALGGEAEVEGGKAGSPGSGGHYAHLRAVKSPKSADSG